ncbi:MAG: hypothetical protein ACTSQE_09050 [Candidatus Heimdallarchaeaceae archaeon]
MKNEIRKTAVNILPDPWSSKLFLFLALKTFFKNTETKIIEGFLKLSELYLKT